MNINDSPLTIDNTSFENISSGVEWKINSDKHIIVIHQAGMMNKLETELNGIGRSFGPANIGELWFIPSGTQYKAKSIGSTVSYSTIKIDPNKPHQNFKNLSPFNKISSAHGLKDLFCLQLVNSITNYNKYQDDISTMVLSSLKDSLYLYLYDNYGLKRQLISEKNQHTSLLSTNDIKFLRQFIHKNMSTAITLEKLSYLFGLNTHQFLKSFKASFGITPAQHIIQERLRKVEWLLNHSDLNITMIAYETGFSSHSHLSATFKKHLGLSPREFKKL